MGRWSYGGPTCESCASIDARRWHREGRLHPGQCFPYSWTRAGEPAGSIRVRTEPEAVVLMFNSRTSEDSEWKSVEQRVPITWTPCHLGGRRAWFRCIASANGQYCGRRVAKLYLGGSPVFACRQCYRLAYASQQESLRHRGHGRFEHGWEAARTCSMIFRTGRRGCTGEPTPGFAILTIPPHDAAVADVVGAGVAPGKTGRAPT
jgi:hypothetical protein